MCFYYKQSADALTLQNRFKAKCSPSFEVTAERFNGFTFPKTPVITNQAPQLIQPYQWGLIPSWAKEESIRKHTLNARIETLEELPSFRNAANQRCLVLADGFYEWQWLDPKGAKKQQFLISLVSEAPFALAGIYSHWLNKSDDTTLRTFSIVTTDATPLMAEIHNSKKRMPVVLTPENESLWLNGGLLSAFTNPDVALKATAI